MRLYFISLIFFCDFCEKVNKEKNKWQIQGVEERCFSPLLRLWIFIVVVYFVGEIAGLDYRNQEEHRV